MSSLSLNPRRWLLGSLALACAAAMPAAAQPDSLTMDLAAEASKLAQLGFDISLVDGAPGGARHERVVKGAP